MTFPRKYRNTPTEFQGRKYDSKAEAQRAAELAILVKQDVIAYWMPQPSVELAGLRYKPDFMVALHTGEIWFEDVKGMETQRFRDIRKLWITSGPPVRLRILKKAGKRWNIEELCNKDNEVTK